jgi:hypothetical protein
VRDAARSELVPAAARASALTRHFERAAAGAAAVLAAIVLAGCGGYESKGPRLAWDGKPALTASPTGARVLIGKVENRSGEELWIRVPEVKVIDQGGRRILSTAVFVSSFVRSAYPHNAGPRSDPSHYPLREQIRVGFLVRIKPGKTFPLTVSWRDPRGERNAARIVLPTGSLPLPATTAAG